MVKLNAALNDRQVEVLRWIADGCAPGVMTTPTYKTTAVALQNRRLVSVSKKKGIWRAEITDAGQYYLDNSSYVPQRQPAVDAALHHPAAAPTGSQNGRTGPPPVQAPAAELPARTQSPATSGASVARKLSPTEQLIADVIAAGGELHVDRSSDKTNYDIRVASAIRFGKVPAGKLLTIGHAKGWHDLVIRLKDPPAWMNAELMPIPVPGQVRRPHKVVAELAADKERLSLTASVRTRALRILQALAAESEARGYRVQGSKTGAHDFQTGDYHGGLLAISVKGHLIGLDVKQQYDRIPHEPTAAERKLAERDSWFRIPTHDRVPTARIELGVLGGREYRKSRWADGSAALDDQLPQILQEVELRSAFKEEQRLAAEREREERHRQWEEAMSKAKKRLRHAHRAEVLLRQVEDWTRATELDRYLDAMEVEVASMADEHEQSAAQQWLDWARRYRQRLDPLNHSLTMPEDPKPTAENLKPYLGPWGFYGPRDSYWP